MLTVNLVGTACGYFLNSTSDTPVLVSGYRVDNTTSSSNGETLLMRILPLVTNPLRHALYGGSIHFKNVQHPIIDALIISAADGSPDSVYRRQVPVAHECVLSWCVKTLRSSFSQGRYREDVISTLINTTARPFGWDTQITVPDFTGTMFRDNITIYPASMSHDNLGYGVSNLTFLDAVTVLDEIFPSLITVANATAEPFLKVRTSFKVKVMYRAVRFSPWLAPNNVPHHMERMAEAMTNAVRSDQNSNERISGKALSRETFVAVHWAWLSFPLTMLLLSIIFLVATMMKTSQKGSSDTGTWKTSAMPTLIYGLPKEMQGSLTTTTHGKILPRNGSKKVRIRLLPKQGWRVSGHVCTSPTRMNSSEHRAPDGWI